jgi:hypothetical protein
MRCNNRLSLCKSQWEITRYCIASVNYLSFPIEVKLDLNKENTIELPSVTFCLKRDDFWHKKTIDGFIEDKNYTHFNQLFDKTVNFSSVLKCLLISNDEKDIKYNEKSEHLGKNVEFLSKSSRL